MNQTFEITLPKDDKGFSSRECPKCHQNFKLKLGTGLPISYCHCPYCTYEAEGKEFLTKEQWKYVESMAHKIAYNRFIKPMLSNLNRSFKSLENSTRGGMIQIKVKTTQRDPVFHIARYSEKDLETYIVCDSCKLEFAIYGIFARCPDCEQLNAYVVCKKSLEVCLKLLNTDSGDDKEVLGLKLQSVLSNAVASFDGLGKALRARYPEIFPDKPKNLFQNILEVFRVFEENLKKPLALSIEEKQFLYKMFQVRHLFEHSMGVIDTDFTNKLPQFRNLMNRKYVLENQELNDFVLCLSHLVDTVEATLARNDK